MNIHTQTIKAAEYLQENLDEYQEHAAVIEWLRYHHREIRFLSNEAGHGRPNAAVHLQDGRSWPDLQIVEKRGPYLSLWLEIKTGPDEVYRKDAIQREDKHTMAQWEMILWLRSQGHAADWGLGQEDCRAKIEAYLEQGEVFYE